MPDDDLDRMPLPEDGVNRPSSGTYGEKAELDRLKSSLPAVDSAGSSSAVVSEPSGSPTVPLPMSQPGSVSSPEGLPQVLLGPTARPLESVTAPVAAPEQSPGVQATAQQRNIDVLIQLANDPRVSEETREWAGLWVRTLAGS